MFVVCVHAGEFEGVGFNDFSSITGAVSTFGFVFYIQPIMMPLLSEMPATERGVKILSTSTRVVVLDEHALQQVTTSVSLHHAVRNRHLAHMHIC